MELKEIEKEDLLKAAIEIDIKGVTTGLNYRMGGSIYSITSPGVASD